MSLLVATEERHSDGLDVHGVVVELSSVATCNGLAILHASHFDVIQKPGHASAVVGH